MKRAALGIRMHSGWGVLVVVAGEADAFEILDRRRIVAADAGTPGAKQPYHFAAELALAEAEKHIAKCAADSERLATAAIGEAVRELERRRYRVAAAAILMGAGRALPALPQILAAHPLIHTAEGEFFRCAARRACEGLNIPVTAVRERELVEQAETVLGKRAAKVQKRISTLSKSIGPPWTADHKAAALAALMALK